MAPVLRIAVLAAAAFLSLPAPAQEGRVAYDPEFLKGLEAAMQAPPAPPGAGRVVEVALGRGGGRLRLLLDLSGQVLRLEVPEERTWRKEAVPLLESAAALPANAFLPAALLALKAKRFDDGLYAAVELAADRALGAHPGRRELLRRVLARLGENTGEPELQAAANLGAAAGLAGIEVPPACAAAAEARRKEFLSDPLRSKPIGFYTWSEELRRIFQRDRMLQTPWKPSEAPAVLAAARALAADPETLAAYEAMLLLASRLTNPLIREVADLAALARDLRAGREPAPKGRFAFFPPSRAHETELIKRLFGNRPIPPGFVLADEMVGRIRAGSLSLAPAPESGWYDHQTWALEPLVAPERFPESARLQLGEGYRAELVGLFKALLALTRETHVKQLETPMVGSAMPPAVELRPALSVEPLCSYYLRRAQSYVFVRNLLEQILGAEALAALHRISEAGPVAGLTLAQELRFLEGLFHGAYRTACAEIGLEPAAIEGLGSGAGPDADRALLRFWQARLSKDPDLGADIRMMVPVFYDLQRKKTKVWLILGLAERPLTVAFAKRPEVEAAADEQGRALDVRGLQLGWDDASVRLAYLVSAEAYVTKLLDRKEFQAHCERWKSPAEIVRRLE